MPSVQLYECSFLFPFNNFYKRSEPGALGLDLSFLRYYCPSGCWLPSLMLSRRSRRKDADLPRWLRWGHCLTGSCQRQLQSERGGPGFFWCSVNATRWFPHSSQQKLPLLREKLGSNTLICMPSAALSYGWMLNYSTRSYTYSATERLWLIARMRRLSYQNSTLETFNT